MARIVPKNSKNNWLHGGKAKRVRIPCKVVGERKQQEPSAREVRDRRWASEATPGASGDQTRLLQTFAHNILFPNDELAGNLTICVLG